MRFFEIAPRAAGFYLFAFFLFSGKTAAAAEARFGFDNVAEIARKAAAETFKPPQPVPDFLVDIGYDDYRDIRFDPAQSLWKDGGRFQIQFIHPGLYYKYTVTINVLNANGVEKVAYSPKMFTYGKNKFADKIPRDLGFAGFRLAYPFNKKDELNHVIVFAGASYFRAVARNQVFGLSADRKSTRLNSSHIPLSRMPSSA